MNSVHSSILAIFGLGAPELIIIFAVLLLLFGGAKLPGLAKGLGQSIREFKKASSDTAKDDDDEDEDAGKKSAKKKEAKPAAEAKTNGDN